MGLREYLSRSDNRSRFGWTALLAILIHGAALAGSGFLMASQVEYGVAGSVAGGGNLKPLPPPQETVDLEDFSDNAPAKHQPKPKPTPVRSTGIGGKVSGQVSEIPAYYRNPPPPYPLAARARKEEGTVLIHAEVDTKGLVSSVALAKSCGFADLDQAALESVKAWQFKPATVMGIPVSTSVNVPIRFRLKDYGLS